MLLVCQPTLVVISSRFKELSYDFAPRCTGGPQTTKIKPKRYRSVWGTLVSVRGGLYVSVADLSIFYHLMCTGRELQIGLI